MSRREWEEGTIKIPQDYYSILRRAVISSFNRAQDDQFNRARKVCEAAREAGFRKRGFSRADWARRNHCDVAVYITRPDSNKVFVPRRKDFPRTPTRRSVVLSFGDVTIKFDNKARTVFYSVDENNHACEKARSHLAVISLFAHLHRIHHWTRGSGGQITGNDEYNKDNHNFDGGANYVTATFGPGKKTAFNGMYFTEEFGARW